MSESAKESGRYPEIVAMPKAKTNSGLFMAIPLWPANRLKY